ncbi:MAG: tRNA (N6-isopentenyl adenosine(37)-C2)-methylthiotransferase MiaB [Acidobacteria bacterium]|nr:MAG: tRNA (N6-isopentenyl adenosine(37)-C2)-methylthiotransferase MiaB [Acidobacteriota bacterium]
MKYLIETFGCQMNHHDSERMAGLLEEAGYARTDDDRDADVIVINTCSVREKAEEKLYTRLGEIRLLGEETGARPVVAVAGCVAQQEGEKLLSKTNGQTIDVLIGTQSIKRLPMLVSEVRGLRTEARKSLRGDSSTSYVGPRTSTLSPRVDLSPYDDVSFPLGIARREDPVKAYVTIIEGCNEFCAFCVVPYTRGHERMRPVSDILDEVRLAADTGAREVQLLGQIVNHYQAPDDPSCDFAELLARVNDVAGVERIRFASPHPRHVTPRMIEAMRDVPKVCRHLHLPVQSGSTRVLQAMRRRHTREHYLELVASLRAAMPDIALSTDMIVGFPGETAEDFEETLTLTRAARYHSMFSFKYSPRPNTLALKRMPEDVSEAEKTRRIVELQAVQKAIQGELFAAAIGRTEHVLIEARSRRREWELSGRTSGNTVVNLPGDPSWVGRIVPVMITGANPNSLRGEAVLDTAATGA